MNTELPSKYDPSAVESQAYRVWLEEKCFHADPAKPGEAYCIVIPPPNVTGALHLGHAINNTLQDILTRQHRMAGFNALWIPGIDHAGIATQAVVEKQLKEKENKTRHDVGREGLIERIWAWKQQFGDRILEQLKRLGCSCDWDRARFTLDEVCARAVRETFFKLFKDGLIYRGKRLVNWDTYLQTSISDDEIYHETVKTNLWHIRYPIVDAGGTGTSGTGFQPVSAGAQKPGEIPNQDTVRHGQNAHATGTHATGAHPTYMVVATTRPETMLADTAVAVHSEDPRWNWAIGQHVRLPLTGRLIPIIADDILVDPKFGTGVVKVTPAHDPNDYAVWQRHKGQPDEIDILNLLTPDGRINNDRPEWSKYAGMKREAARKQVVQDLAHDGLLEKEEPYETQVGHSDRSKTPIEPYLSDQWFVKMAPLAEPALEVVREQIIKFFPERYAQTYLSWLGEKRDWPISRQLWWGHQIPVWTTGLREIVSGSNEAERKEEELQSAFDRLATSVGTAIAYRVRLRPIFIGGSVAAASAERMGIPTQYHEVEICANSKSADQRLKEVFTFLNQSMLRSVAIPAMRPSWLPDETEAVLLDNFVIGQEQQDPDVLDTWFSSALWPHSTLGWPEDTPELRKYYPTSVLVTGRDIITLWVARMVMMGMYNMGQAKAVEALSPSPLYSGEKRVELATARERAGVRGGTSNDPASQTPSTLGPSPQPSPLSTGEREQRARALGIPFHYVAINPTILDGKGERMSKSKGNGVDPVDIIESYGADALRFTLTKMATETQDARMPVKKDAQGRNTSEKFDEGRNFCNKLWNACRFALISLEGGSGFGVQGSGEKPGEESASQARPLNDQSQIANRKSQMSGPDLSTQHSALSTAVDESRWSLADRWIVSRFNRTVDEANKALDAYRFDVYAKACYDFFWRDFCDWYVEAIKPALKDPARRDQTAHVLASVLDGSLRLMHPMIPFITETVWWRLNDVRPQRGLPGRIECPPSRRLVLAAWPKVGDFSEAAEHIFPKLQEIIGTIRNIRNEHQVNPRQSVTVSIRADSEKTRQIEANREMILLLATCDLKAVGPQIPPAANAATATAAGCEIFVEGLVDPNTERQRLGKSIEDAKKKMDAIKGRLSNEAYISKAPPNLVQQSRDQLAALEAEQAKLEEALRKLG